MTTTPPGWYDDGHGALRWWDGVQWTEHVAQPDPEPSAAPTEAEIVAAQLGFEQQPAEQVAPAAPAAPSIDPGVAAYLAQQSPAAAAPQQPVAEPAAVAPSYGSPQPDAPQYAAAPQYGTAPSYSPQYPADPAHTQAAYPGGAFAAATEPRTSKLWIVWVVLGVVLLGIVIAVAVVVPLLILNVSSNGSAAQSDDEKVAVAAVQSYDHAWQTGDCDELLAVTTDEFRAASQYVDCETFQSDAASFDDTFDDYTLAITEVESDDDGIEITTNETYTLLVDENGDPAEPAPGATVYHYTLVPEGDAWVIDDLYYDE